MCGNLFPVAIGRETGKFPELPAKMFNVIITAQFGDFTNRSRSRQKLVLSPFDALTDDILHAGGTKHGSVERLQITGTEMESIGHDIQRQEIHS